MHRRSFEPESTSNLRQSAQPGASMLKAEVMPGEVSAHARIIDALY